MNQEKMKELAKEHAITLGGQILELVGQALINFAKQVTTKKAATLSVITDINVDGRVDRND